MVAGLGLLRAGFGESSAKDEVKNTTKTNINTALVRLDLHMR
jgi:hypothetical protein